MAKPKVILVWGMLCIALVAAATAFLSQVEQHRVSDQQATNSMVAQGDREAVKNLSEPDKQAFKTHQVVSGESLHDIAAKYNLDIDTILSANPDITETIQPGDQLLILPDNGALHLVETGDTLWDIAIAYGVDIQTIKTANSKENNHLTVAEKLWIPGGKLQRSAVPVSRYSGGRFVWPAAGELTSPFGYRWGRLHAGIDIANGIGTPVRAAKNGRVIFTGWLGGYGYTVALEHAQGYETLYGHLADYIVSVGEYVRTGQVIAYMGNTGYSTGPHLHFEIRAHGQPINPISILP